MLSLKNLALGLSCAAGLQLLAPVALAQGAPTEFTNASAAASNGITLPAAQALAMERNPTLRAAQQAVAASEGAVLQSQARPNPELAYTQEDTRLETRAMTLQWNQALEVGGKRAARMQVAEHGRALALAELALSRAALRADVRTAFIHMLAAQERVQLSQDSLQIASQARDAAAKRVQAGKSAPLEETKARVAESSAQLALTQAQSQLRVAGQQLAAFWGGQPASLGIAQGQVQQLPGLPDQAHLLSKIEQSPLLTRAQQAFLQSKSVAELERAKRVPDPTVSLGVKRAQELGRNQLVLGISVPLPVFDSNRGNQLQALRLADKAEDELLATRQRLQAQVQQSYEQLQTSRAQARQLADVVLPSAQSAYAVAVKGFTLGKFSYLDVLDAQRTLAEARGLYLEQLIATHRAAADITRELGEIPELE